MSYSGQALHAKSSVVSPTGFSLAHLTEEEVERLKETACELRKRFDQKGGMYLQDFDTLKNSVKLIKELFVDPRAFMSMQMAKKVPTALVEMINDMISIAKGTKTVMPVALRHSYVESSNTPYPKLPDFNNARFIWLETALKNNYSHLMEITLYVLGETDDES